MSQTTVLGLVVGLIVFIFNFTSAVSQRQGRVIEGTPAVRGQFPFQVAIQNSGVYCSGSLISDRFILGCAHCVGAWVREFNVHIGAIEYDGNEMHRVSEFSYLHNKDLAIFKLKNPVALSDTVQPIRLPTVSQMYAPFKDVIAFIAGFAGGKTLNYMTVRIKAMKWSSIESVPYLNPNSRVVSGDSGTSLLIYENGIATQLGVVVLSSATAVNIGLELNWINDVTGIPVRKYSFQ